MKLLVVAPYCPFPTNGGGEIRVYNQLRLLAARHEVFLAYPDNVSSKAAALNEAKTICRQLLPFPTVPDRYANWDLRRWRAWRSLSSLRPLIMRDTVPNVTQAVDTIVTRLGGTRPDVIHLHQYHVAGLGLALKKRLGEDTKILLDEHNFEPGIWTQLARDAHRPDRRLVFGWEARKLRRSLRRVYPFLDAVSAVSQDDKEALEQLTGRSNIAIVPNGVDTAFFKRTTPTVPTSDEILFTGTLGYEPNLDGLLYFLNDIWPRIQAERPQTRLLIVGRHAPPAITAWHNGTSVQVIGPVPDMRPYYERARVFIVPLRWGGGTRLKVLEALAMQVPIVSTTAGVSGLKVTLGDHYLCGDTPESFANLTLRLLDIKGPARHLAIAGRKLVEAHYDWQGIIKTVENLYASIA